MDKEKPIDLRSSKSSSGSSGGRTSMGKVVKPKASSKSGSNGGRSSGRREEEIGAEPKQKREQFLGDDLLCRLMC